MNADLYKPIEPQDGSVAIYMDTPDSRTYLIENFNVASGTVFFLVPAADYQLGTLQAVSRGGATTLSTGNIEMIVANTRDAWATPPTAPNLTAPGITDPFGISSTMIGFRVKTAQSSVTVDLYLHLRRQSAAFMFTL